MKSEDKESVLQDLSKSKRKGEYAATHLLEKAPPEDYLKEWTKFIAQERNEIKETTTLNSILIFRLSSEWLALSIITISQIIEYKIIHRIPQRSNDILLGLVNMRGQMKLCVALNNLLQIVDNPTLSIEEKKVDKTMVVIERENDVWVFPVDEILGIYQCNLKELENVPVTVSKSTANFLRGMFNYKEKSIGLLDEDLLFDSLKRSII